MSNQAHKVLVVEDEMIIAMSLSDTLEELGYQVLGTCDSFEETIQVLEQELPDVALVDIKLKGDKTGIDIGKVINERFQIPFIFLTSNSDKATIDQAKSTVPASYLLKPFEADELYAAIEVAIEQGKNTSTQKNSALQDALFVRKSQLLHRVAYSDIVYLKSDHVYVELYTKNKQKHVLRGSLSQFLTSLPQSFFRTHRSYAVNLDYLEAINSLYIIANGEQIPIGKTYRGVLLDQVRVE